MAREGKAETNRSGSGKMTRCLPGRVSEYAADRKYMSVREMGDLLGLKKTDRYWLVHKKVFDTKTLIGKMWVDVASFEKWYANQVKYRKVTGEEPGRELKARSYSPWDIAELLGICEQGVYELIRRHKIETIVVDYRMRIPKDAFQRWYESQVHYRTAADREKEASLVAASVTMPEMAELLGITRQKVYMILKDRRYQHFFEFIKIRGRRRITRESLQRFLDGQDVYRTVSERVEKIQKACSEGVADISRNTEKRLDGTAPKSESVQMVPEEGYLTLREAAELACISRQALNKYIDLGVIEGAEKCGGRVRIPKREFGKWIIQRMLKQEETADGID